MLRKRHLFPAFLALGMAMGCDTDILLQTPTTTKSDAPTVAPTIAPTVAPTIAPTVAPTVAPTIAPTIAPTVAPTIAPTIAPTVAPTIAPTNAPFSVSFVGFNDGQVLPEIYSFNGGNTSVPFHWSAPPAGTKSFAAVFIDPDAGNYVHWMVLDLPSSLGGLDAGISGSLAAPAREITGTSGPGWACYFGPCPPYNSNHHYFARVYALDVERLSFEPTLDDLPYLFSRFGAAISGHVLAQAQGNTYYVGR